MKHTHIATAILTAALAFAAVTGLHATQRRPLPPFMVTSLDGQPVSSTELPQQGNWLLIYVEPSCGSCVAVLSAMPPDEYPGLAAHITVVVAGASVDQARAMAAAATEVGDARWLIDVDRSAGKALGLRNSPLMLGVRDSMIEWALTGVFRKGPEMKSILVSWLSQPRP